MNRRKKIISEAHEWLIHDMKNRGQICIMIEKGFEESPRISNSIGGDYELVLKALFATLYKMPKFEEILNEALSRYNNSKKSMN